MNYANERSRAATERSSQDTYDVIRLTRSKAAVWTVDDVARLTEKKRCSYLFIYLFQPSVAYYPEGWQKLDRLRVVTKLYKTVLYLFISVSYEHIIYSKRFIQPVVKPVVQPAVKCIRTVTGSYNIFILYFSADVANSFLVVQSDI